jgi:hypothetical protein
MAEAGKCLNFKHIKLQQAIQHYLNPKENKVVNVTYDKKKTEHMQG